MFIKIKGVIRLSKCYICHESVDIAIQKDKIEFLYEELEFTLDRVKFRYAHEKCLVLNFLEMFEKVNITCKAKFDSDFIQLIGNEIKVNWEFFSKHLTYSQQMTIRILEALRIVSVNKKDYFDKNAKKAYGPFAHHISLVFMREKDLKEYSEIQDPIVFI